MQSIQHTVACGKTHHASSLSLCSTQFHQIARTVADAAVLQQRDIRQANAGFSSSIGTYAQTSNVSWPFVSLPLCEAYGRQNLIQSGTELFVVFNKVTSEDREEYVNFTIDNHEAMVKEGHMFKTGSLDNLTPQKFHPYMSTGSPHDFMPDIERDYYFPAWHTSPPPASYNLLNWNIASIPSFDALFRAVIELKNESLVSHVQPSIGVPTALTQEQYQTTHIKKRGDDPTTEFPQTFVYTPIHKTVGDYNSEVVAIVATAYAWDASLRNLLPEGVEGILCVIRNSCDQVYTYEITGRDAFFLGEGDLHASAYDDKTHEVDLALHTHPDFTTTPGHCKYSMVGTVGSKQC
jgi:hypothetical protein